MHILNHSTFIWTGPMNSPVSDPEVLAGAAYAVGRSVTGVRGMELD